MNQDFKIRPMGRPLLLNKTLVNSICRAVEDEMLPREIITERFNIFPQTFAGWIETGQACKNKPLEELTIRETLCVQLSTRLDDLYAKHEQTLIESLQQSPEVATVARLVMCLSPEWSVVENFSQHHA